MKNEPVLSAAALSGLLIALASSLGVVLDLGTVETVVAALLPIAAAFLARRKVMPT